MVSQRVGSHTSSISTNAPQRELNYMYLHNKLNGRGRKLPAPVEVALGLNDTWYVKYKDGRFDHSLATTTADSFDAWTKGWHFYLY